MLVSCLLAVGALPQTARAQDDFQRSLRAAVQLYEELEYEQALEQLQKARRLALGDEQEVAVALHEGIILGDMGQRDQSRAAFRKGLRLNPEAKLPLKVSPKLQKDFEELRAEVRQARRGAGTAVAGTDQPRQPDLTAPTPPAPEPFIPSKEGSARARVPVVPLVLGGVGVAAAGVGAVFGVRSRSNVEEARKAYAEGLPPQSEVSAVDARLSDARGQARMANVLFGTAVVAAGGAVVTWLLQADSAGASSEEIR
jgi:tetratricopeptide (TPR) repeat protein